MTSSASWVLPIALCAVFVVLVIGALAAAFRMRSAARWPLAIVALVLAAYMGWSAVMGSFYVYADRSYDRVCTLRNRTAIKSVLRGFREAQVPVTDIPGGFQNAAWGDPKYSVYRYSFGVPDNCIHVVYDKQGTAVAIIPTYE